MFEVLRNNKFFKNVDIINTINKILVDKVPQQDAINLFLKDKENIKDVYIVLEEIYSKDKFKPHKLISHNKNLYVYKLNQILTDQMKEI